MKGQARRVCISVLRVQEWIGSYDDAFRYPHLPFERQYQSWPPTTSSLSVTGSPSRLEKSAVRPKRRPKTSPTYDDGVRKSRARGLSLVDALATAGVRLDNSNIEVLPYASGAYGRMPRPPVETL